MVLLRSHIYIFVLVMIDQMSKYFILKHLKGTAGYFVNVTSFLKFVVAWNHGVSFGLFGGFYQYSNIFFIIINSFIIIYIFFLLSKAESMLTESSYILILGGAIGNIIGRVDQGAVFDFLYFHLGEYSFPAFNLADSFIFVGVCCLIIDLIKNSPKKTVL